MRRDDTTQLPHLSKPAYQWAINVYYWRRLYSCYTLIRARAGSNKHQDEDPVPNARYNYIYRVIILLREIHNFHTANWPRESTGLL